MTISKRHLLAIIAVAVAWQAPSHALVHEWGMIRQIGPTLPPTAPDYLPSDDFAYEQDDTVSFDFVEGLQQVEGRGEGPEFLYSVSVREEFPLFVTEELGTRTLVPLPGALWLLISALSLVGMLRRPD